MIGWVKLHRTLIDWEWWDDHNATRLLTYLLCAVNYENKRWKGIDVKPGEIVTSFPKLAEHTGMSVKQVRVAMDKLISSGEVAREKAREGQLITLRKWDKLQSKDNEGASSKADGGQEEGRKRATTKEVKNKRSKEQCPPTPQGGDSESPSKTKNSPTASVSVGAREADEAKNLRKLEIDESLTYLNQKAGANFKLSTKAHRKFISGRIIEGATVQDLKAVIDLKVREWSNDTKMSKYLRPETLFGPTKFDGYLSETKRAQSAIPTLKYDHTKFKEGETYLDRLIRNKIDPRKTEEVAVFVMEEKLQDSYVKIIQHHFKTNPEMFPYVN